ncbi:MAG: hypothetical protein Q9209_006774 [Squamulea sp. 1 TL-2023]
MGNSASTIAGDQTTAEKKRTTSGTCPVDEESRKVWLEAARKGPGQPRQLPAIPILQDSISSDERALLDNISDRETEKGRMENKPLAPSSSRSDLPKQNGAVLNTRQERGGPVSTRDNMTSANKMTFGLGNSSKLGTDRVTSSIPRADMALSTTTPDPRSMPSSEGAAQKSGNWIYPSEKMFFDAMKRKSFSPDQKDMPAIVPIHNAVNERAWSMIKTWESSSARLKALNGACGGPKLRSFSGDAAKLSPKARMLGWVGYQAPFDRHDWVVERCEEGGAVEYVIDFYKGRGDGLAFYLDVRPKLNTWEGCRMRIGSWVGLT